MCNVQPLLGKRIGRWKRVKYHLILKEKKWMTGQEILLWERQSLALR